ncbi:MAG: sulfotransferase [Rhodothermia bacterium]|nr:sulfotransferase [Rhodothermia bacterium]
MKVLFIASVERSGSTILQNVLAQSESVFAAGEVRNLWDRGLGDNRPCGCGTPIRECSVWTSVLREAFGGVDLVDARQMARLRDRARARHVPTLRLPFGKTLVKHRLGEYPEALVGVYRSIASVSGCEVVLDTSKSPLLLPFLVGHASFELYVIHLIRDPRGVEYSFQKRKVSGHKRLKDHSTAKGALHWILMNKAIEDVLGRVDCMSMTLRYEDFTERPRECSDIILNWMGVESALPWTNGVSLHMTPTHTIVGSPHRFNTGNVAIRKDEKWRTLLPRENASRAWRIAGSFAKRYGYQES